MTQKPASGAQVRVFRLLGVITASAFFVVACAQIPEKPTSVYFERLLQAVPMDDDYAPHDLIEPRSSLGEESQIVADLIKDGFEPQLGTGYSAKRLGYITCEGFPFVKVGLGEKQFRYHLSLIWGSPFLTVFYVDIHRDDDCGLLGITGARFRRTM